MHPLRLVGIFFALMFVAEASRSEVGVLRPEGSGQLITKSVRIAPGVYRLTDPEDQGAIVIRGDNLTVDFAGAILVGSPEGTDADGYLGRGITVRGQNVTVKNATVRGYKIGVYAEDGPGLRITGCDVSHNYRQRLKSTPEREDLSDWLYGHENDQNEWLRYGAGVYLLRCPDARVTGNRARNGQNGICLCRCDRARVTDNDMSFMSGWGLAMWRSSHCEVSYNKFDWCVRGYSHGVYARGQDSAGILVYEQCSDNLFAFNSATHGGDGFFLYAGNETLKGTGQGGCNRNIVYRNDFSHAVANGIEATFSDGNIFVGNLLKECTHGIWAGYSYDTVIERNTIAHCTYGVSIEHGANNRVCGNTITDTRLGVQLWWDDDKDLLASAFCNSRNGCRSHGNKVLANRFEGVETAIRLAADTGSAVGRNAMTDVDTSVEVAGNVGDLQLALFENDRRTLRNETRAALQYSTDDLPAFQWTPSSIVTREPRLISDRGKSDVFLPDEAPRGREYIFVDEWGPFDFADLRLFPQRALGGKRAVFQLVGPEPADFTAIVTGDAQVTPNAGRLPARLTVEATGPGGREFALQCRVDDQVVGATGFLLNADWRVQFFGWRESSDPRADDDMWKQIIAGDPLANLAPDAIDFVWYGRSPTATVPPDHFATVATTKVDLPAGTWRAYTISDDGVRVFIDRRKVIDNWTHHAPTLDEATVELASGVHTVRIEHFEITGHAQLQFRIEPDR